MAQPDKNGFDDAAMKDTELCLTEDDFELQDELIDLHLGALGADDEAELRARLAQSVKLSAQHEESARVFGALAAWRAPAAPANLAQRICAGLPGHAAPRRLTLVEHVERDNAPILRMTNFREITAVAAMIVLAVGLGVPSMLHMRERASRTMCTNNLASIGRGMQAYATVFGDSLPFVGWNGHSSWQQSAAAAGLDVVPNRRHLYPLLRGRHVQAPNVFVCPSSGDVPMAESTVAQHNDFIESSNVSYANLNMAGVRPSLRDRPGLPVLADDNPLFEDGVPMVDFAARQIGLKMDTWNSRAHGGAGQNILTLGGSVKWFVTPSAGLDGENIWTLQGVERYTGREGPRTTTDSHLIK